MAIKVETIEVDMEVTGDKKATKSFKSVAVAAAAAVVVFRAAAKALKAVTDAWAIQERALIKVESALKATGQSSKATTREIKSFTSSLQAATNVGDEVTLAMVGTAIAMGQTADQAQIATESAVGLSEALGIGLEASLKAVVNAQEGNYQQLQRYLPALKGVTDDTEAWDIINKATASGLDSLSESTDTLTGQTTRLSNAWGDYKEQIGRVFALNPPKIINQLSDALERAIGKWERTNDMQEWYNEQMELGADLTGIQVKQVSDWTAANERGAGILKYLNEQLEDFEDLSDLWKPEKTRDFWQEFTDGIIAANTNMSEAERIEYQRAEAIRSSKTEFADFNQQIEDQINLYYDEELAIIAIREQEARLAEERAAADKAERAAAAQRIAQKQAEKEAIMSMYSTLKNIVQTYYSNEIQAAGDNEEKLQEIREKQFRANQAFGIADTIINTATAIMKVLSQGGLFAIPIAAAMGVLGAAQIATIASAKPSFATGTSGYVVPPGYENDTFPVSAATGETVTVSRPGQEGGQMLHASINIDGYEFGKVITRLFEDRKASISGVNVA